MIITLLSDLGHSDPYVALAKTIIIKYFPNAQIIDISHDIPPLSIIQAAYIWKCTTKAFPSNTYHISLTDLIMSLPNNIIIHKKDNHCYLCTDNGLMTAFTNQTHFKIGMQVSSTFADYVHSACENIRDLTIHNWNDDHLLQYNVRKIINFPEVTVHENEIQCIVIHIDRYENIVLNLQKDQFKSIKGNRNFVIRLLRKIEITEISDDFASNNKKDEIIAYFNEFGYLQLSLRDISEKSASLLGFSIYKKDYRINNFVTISFI